MGPAEQFATIVGGPESELRLDLAALCISAALRPGVDVDGALDRLDELAAAGGSSFASIRAHLFDAVGFRGDVADYGDPRNSFLDEVLARRVGIPITLGVVLMEVGRRAGVTIEGVGMPGHFLTRVPDADRWCDPFHGGALLDRAAVTSLFARVTGAARPPTEHDLAPVPPRAILARMLTNLEVGRLGLRAREAATMCELHLEIPGLELGQQVQLLRRLARAGDPVRVEAAYQAVIARAPDDVAEQLRAQSAHLNARWN
jgi:hypothetical protein